MKVQLIIDSNLSTSQLSLTFQSLQAVETWWKIVFKSQIHFTPTIYQNILIPIGNKEVNALQLIRVMESMGRHEFLLITAADLYLNGLTFVFGATIPHTASIVSLSRLCGRQDMIRRELLHELGHFCGLAHCTHNSHCVMRHSASIHEIERRCRTFCSSCLNRINSYLLSCSRH